MNHILRMLTRMTERLIISSATGKRFQTVCLTWHLGRLVKRKGHAWFIKNVLPKLPENVLYVIAGTGPEREKIEQAAEKYGFQNKVILLGKVSPDTLRVLYNTVDAFIQPNISVKHDAEGFGLVLLEAALCECPVFAARLEGIPNAIQDGHNGTLLPTQDAAAWVKTLTYFLQQQNTKATQARQYTLQNFSWDTIAPRYSVVFK